MNLVASARSKLLLQGTEALTQAQYEAITSPYVQAGEVLRIHDEVFGGNLRKIPDKNLDNGPFIVHDGGFDGEELLNDAEDGGDEEDGGLQGPPAGNLLTDVTA